MKYLLTGGGKCKFCKSENTTKADCPWNPEAIRKKKTKPEKHPKARGKPTAYAEKELKKAGLWNLFEDKPASVSNKAIASSITDVKIDKSSKSPTLPLPTPQEKKEEQKEPKKQSSKKQSPKTDNKCTKEKKENCEKKEKQCNPVTGRCNKVDKPKPKPKPVEKPKPKPVEKPKPKPVEKPNNKCTKEGKENCEKKEKKCNPLTGRCNKIEKPKIVKVPEEIISKTVSKSIVPKKVAPASDSTPLSPSEKLSPEKVVNPKKVAPEKELPSSTNLDVELENKTIVSIYIKDIGAELKRVRLTRNGKQEIYKLGLPYPQGAPVEYHNLYKDDDDKLSIEGRCIIREPNKMDIQWTLSNL